MFNSDDLKSIRFAAIVCVIVSLLLATAASSLRPLQKFNKELDRKKNVLQAVLGKEKVEKMSADEVVDFFESNLEEILIDEKGELITDKTRADYAVEDKKLLDDRKRYPVPLYIYKEDGKVTSYIYQQYGMGLWSVIYSYVALNKDMATIRGITFFGHKETPGLGGEVSKEKFTSQFIDKKLYADGKPTEFVVTKAGKYKGGDSEVDGVSGSTLTGNGIQEYINETFATYNVYFEKERDN